MKKREPAEEALNENTLNMASQQKGIQDDICTNDTNTQNIPEESTTTLQKYMGSFVFQSVVKAVAEKIIDEGRDEVVAFLNEIDKKDSPSAMEKSVANALLMKLSYMDSVCSLEDEGADMDVLEDDDFIEFAKICDVNMPLKDIYKYYMRLKQNKIDAKPIGSAVDTAFQGRKNYYSPKEVDALNKEDFQKDPKLLEIVKKSMTKWK